MSQPDLRPFSQKFAMWLIKSRAGLKFSTRGKTKAALVDIEGVQNDRIDVPSREAGRFIGTRVYKPKGSHGPLPIVVYFHGGGYATGWPERHHAFYKRLIDTRPCIIVVPAFRSSLDAPYPAGHEDCYDTLLWVRDNVSELGGRSDWIAVAGNSSGGGIALSMAMQARDTGDLKLAFQMPLYPMIDDRSNRWSKLPSNKITWSKHHGILAWHLLLKTIRTEKTYNISAYAAPARATDLSNLPPTISYVGTHDILLNEVESIAERLKAAGNDICYRTFDGLFHAMEDSVPTAGVSQEVHSWVETQFASYVDQYCSD